MSKSDDKPKVAIIAKQGVLPADVVQALKGQLGTDVLIVSSSEKQDLPSQEGLNFDPPKLTLQNHQVDLVNRKLRRRGQRRFHKH